MPENNDKIEFVVVPNPAPNKARAIAYAVITVVLYWLLRTVIPIFLYLAFPGASEFFRKWNFFFLDLITFFLCLFALMFCTTLIKDHDPTRILSNKIAGGALFVTFAIQIIGIIVSGNFTVSTMNALSCSNGLYLFFNAKKL